MLGIDQVNNAVQGSRFTPPLVTPVAAAIRKHAGEVADCGNAWSGKTGAGVSVNPRVPTVSGTVNEVAVVVGEASATLVHSGDVYVTSDRVAGNLDVANERAAAVQLMRGPGATVVSRDANEARAATH